MEMITTIRELKEALASFDDKDQVVLATTDLNTGDEIDLYPFYIDKIDGIQLTNGDTVSEIRLCQTNKALTV